MMTDTKNLRPEWVTKESMVEEKQLEKPLGMFEFKAKVVWLNVYIMAVMHVFAFYGVWLATLQFVNGKIVTMAWLHLMFLVGHEGITIGAHRLYAHRSFKATKPLEILLILAQAMAGQLSLYYWVRDHRLHHKHSDTDADIHNSNRGFFFCHIGWIFMKKHPEVISKGKTVDISDLEANPIIMFQKENYLLLHFLMGFVVPVLTPVYFWEEDIWSSIMINYFTRYVLQLHVTFLVNSIAHKYGNRPYDLNILPVESSLVSFLTIGEGWHNYHHAFPWDYRASEYGKHFNITTSIINMLAKAGWVYDLRKASDSVVAARIERQGDGSHPVAFQQPTEKKERTILEEYRAEHKEDGIETQVDEELEDGPIRQRFRQA